MSIKVKSGGAYADITGVFHKRAGAYEAVQGVFVKAGGVYGRGWAEPDSWVFDQRGMNFNGEAMTDARNCAF